MLHLCLRAKGGSCLDLKSTRLNSSHDQISYAVFCLKKKNSFQQNDLEFGIFFHHSGSSATTSGGSRHCCCAHAKFLFDGFHQVVEFHDRHAVQRGQKCVF